MKKSKIKNQKSKIQTKNKKFRILDLGFISSFVIRHSSFVLLLSTFYFLLSTTLFAQEVLSRETLTEVIKNYILEKDAGFKNARIEINIKKLDQDLLTNRETQLKVALPIYTRLQGEEIIPIEIYLKGSLIQKIYPLVEIKGVKKVVVVNKTFKKGGIITHEDLQTSEKDLSLLPYQALEDMRDAVGKEAVSSIREGTILQNWMIRDIPKVRKSDEVMVLAEAGNVIVKRQGVVLKDAYEGEKVEVKLMDSPKKVCGLVRNGQIVIEIPE